MKNVVRYVLPALFAVVLTLSAGAVAVSAFEVQPLNCGKCEGDHKCCTDAVAKAKDGKACSACVKGACCKASVKKAEAAGQCKPCECCKDAEK